LFPIHVRPAGAPAAPADAVSFPRVPHSLRRDLAVIATFVATAFVIGVPILTDGWVTYFDNPPHLAELHALASEGACGWTDIGFAGLSLDTLHSPALWHLLALLDGTPLLGPVYGALVCLSVAAPGVAIYLVARRRVAWGWAAALGYVVMIQRMALVGSASATGGMWAFYLAAAAWILLADRLARATTGPTDRAAIAGLLGFIGLVHLYVLEAAMILVAVHAAWTLLSQRVRSDAPPLRAVAARDTVACLLAVAAAAAYWLPVALGAPGFDRPQNLPPGMLAQLLVLPTDPIELLSTLPPASALPFYLESIPMVVVLAAGLLGVLYIRRRDADPLPAYGGALAALVFVLLVVASATDAKWLGPNSWRFLYFVRVGAALAAIPWLARLRAPRLPRAAPVVAAIAAIAGGRLWGAPLWNDVPALDGAEMTDVRALWRWIANHDDGARIYLQDTFMATPDDELSRSHVLALTLRETGVRPLGPYYGIIPSTTVHHVASEFGWVFGAQWDWRKMHAGMHVRAPLGAWGATRLVSDNPNTAYVLDHGGWHVIARIGRFIIWDHPAGDTLAPTGTRDGNRLSFDLDGDAVVPVAYHAFWDVVEPAQAHLAMAVQGTMEISNLPPGRQHVVLAYDPPRVWPVSVAGWLGIVGFAWIGVRGRRARA
jgi:hypothetical protein